MQLLLGLLPLLLRIAGMILDKNNANNVTKQKVLDLIDAVQKDDKLLISVQAKDKFATQKQKILEQIEKDKGTT